MRVRVDHKADAVYLNLTDHKIAESEEIAVELSWITTRKAGSLGWKSSMPRAAPAILAS